MPLSDIVTVNLSLVANGVQQAGFGVPLILSHDAWATSERTRTYNSIAGVAADFATTSPTYLAAQALFSQSPAPPSVMVGRSAYKPTQVKVFSVLVVGPGVYAIRVNTGTGSQVASYTANGTDTNDSIVAGLVAAFNALNAPALSHTATATGTSGSKVVTLTGNAAGNWIGTEVLNTTILSVAETTADPGVANDLIACANESNAWYALVTLFNSSAIIAAAAAWTEANGRLYIVSSADTKIANDANVGATDIGHALNSASYMRTAIAYHPASDVFFDASWDGDVLPDDPGSETWAFKTLAGVPATTLTATQIANLKAKNVNWYYQVAGLDITQRGTVAGGEWIDVIRFRDWLVIGLQEDVLTTVAQNKKVAYTDKGTKLIEAAVRGRLQQGVDAGGLSSDPAFTVINQKVANQSSSDKHNRIFRGMSFAATLAGAIHNIVLNGTVTE